MIISDRALITGASSGLGKDFALNLAKRGTHLILAARRTEHLNQLAEEIRKKYQVEVEVVTIDLTQDKAAQMLFETCTREGKVVNFLINNAGAGPFRSFLDATTDDHERVLKLNALSLTSLCHLFGKHMKEHGKKSWILNVASVASYQPVPRFSVYCATKSYVRILSEIIHTEFQGSNISVSCLCPGGTATEFLAANNQTASRFGEWSLMKSEDVVNLAIRKTFSGKRVIIPGIANKIACVLAKIFPNNLNLWMSHQLMSLGVSESDKG
jgi:uncharacterized protein